MQLEPQTAVVEVDTNQSYRRRADLLRQRNFLESPICRLPAELFSRIVWFSIASIRRERNDLPSTILRTKDLFLLGSVCSHWYYATRSDTQFWNTFAIHDMEGPGADSDTMITSMPDYMSLLRHYYKHVDTAGLSVWIYNFNVEYGLEMIDPIIRVILEENPGKLKSFHVWDDCPQDSTGQTQAECICPSIFDYAQRDVQFTKLVELEFNWGCELPTSSHVLFRNSPLLRTLSLDILGESLTQTRLEFPWKLITTIKLRHTDPEHTLKLLSLHPHFNDFSFHLTGYYGEDTEEKTWLPPSQALFNMQSTTKLQWTSHCLDPNGRDPWCIQLFTHFRFPNLRYLDWRAVAPSDNPSTRNFFASMQRLECLRFYSSARSCISQYFDVFENLKTLDINLGWEADFDRQMVKNLILTSGNGNLFPRLKVLNITSYSNDISCSALIAILYSRRYGPIPWTRLEVDLDSLTLPPRVDSSAELEHHGHLHEFSYQSPRGFAKLDSNPHYGALVNLISQAKTVYGGLDFPRFKLIFEI
ncbi:hypothetical protein Agabi119p4_1576 [Agaricus bisporus var. burnettii]|uniref:F-box domain-containing protein n=1 Tax=Agaricus bisporus var. burnettii TaxID=192524 RepID=A0A8H7F7K2_AGABI|nr:hypothetical protein Agabi119p4_1576 [Agaricus bisporus var. burnettii]